MVGRVPETDAFGRQNAARDQLEREARDALRIDGSQFVRLYEKMQALIADLNSTVIASIAANSYTKTQIDSRIGAPPYAVSTSTHLTVGGQLSCVDAYNTDITWTRRTSWVGNDGRFGYASSSREKKIDIQLADFDVKALLNVAPSSFFYRAEIARRTQLRIDGKDLDYRPQREYGLIAQDLDAAGFGAFVYYDADGKPEGIEYSMLVVPLLAVARAQRDEIATLRSQVAAIAAHLKLDL